MLKYAEALTPGAVSTLSTAEGVQRFVLGGNARFTLRSAKTGTRFTYKVRAHKEKQVWFVSVLTGPENENDYTYAGIIVPDGPAGEHIYKSTPRSRISDEAPSIKALRWSWAKIASGVMPEQLEFWHEGRCGCCARLLTVPESIASGIGPECAKGFI